MIDLNEFYYIRPKSELERVFPTYLQVSMSFPSGGADELPLIVHLGPRMFLNVGPVGGDVTVHIVVLDWWQEQFDITYALVCLRPYQSRGTEGRLLDLYRFFKRKDIRERTGEIMCNEKMFPELERLYDVVKYPATTVSSPCCIGRFRFCRGVDSSDIDELAGSMDLSFSDSGLTVDKSPIAKLACEFILKISPKLDGDLGAFDDMPEKLEKALQVSQKLDAARIKATCDHYLKPDPQSNNEPLLFFHYLDLHLETGPVVYGLTVPASGDAALRVSYDDEFRLKNGDKPSPSDYQSPNNDITELLDLLLLFLHHDPKTIAAFCLKLKVLGYSKTDLPSVKTDLKL